MTDFIASVGCVAALVFGLIGLIKPAVLKRYSRWDGAAILLLMPVLVGISLIANPKVTQPGETLESVREGGIAIMVFFGLLAIGAFLIGLWVSAKRPSVGGSARPELDPEESLRIQREWVAKQKAMPRSPRKPRKTWREIWAETKAQQEKADQERAARRAEKRAQREATQATLAEITSHSWKEGPAQPDRSAEEVDARTRAARRAKLAASPEQVAPSQHGRANVASEPAIERVAKAVAGKSVPVPMPEWCKPKSAEIEELIELRGRGKSSGWAGFMHYTDASGDTSSRRIVCRSISGNGRPETVTAYCCERKAHRTFRIDRIDELICIETGEVLDPATHFAELWSKGALKVADKTLTDFSRVLVFMARCDGEFHPLELKEVEAALWRYGAEFGLDDKTIKTAVRGVGKIAPDSEDFVDSLKRISHHRNARLLSRLLLDSVDRVAAADGRIDRQEAEWATVVGDALKVMQTA